LLLPVSLRHVCLYLLLCLLPLLLLLLLLHLSEGLLKLWVTIVLLFCCRWRVWLLATSCIAAVLLCQFERALLMFPVLFRTHDVWADLQTAAAAAAAAGGGGRGRAAGIKV
jgi:hypothetical protein